MEYRQSTGYLYGVTIDKRTRWRIDEDDMRTDAKFTLDILELKKTNALTPLSDEYREYYNKFSKDIVEYE